MGRNSLGWEMKTILSVICEAGFSTGSIRGSKRLFLQLQLFTAQKSIKFPLEHLKSCTAHYSRFSYNLFPCRVRFTFSTFFFYSQKFGSILCEHRPWPYQDERELSTLPCPEVHHKASYMTLTVKVTMLFPPPFIFQEWAIREILWQNKHPFTYL